MPERYPNVPPAPVHYSNPCIREHCYCCLLTSLRIPLVSQTGGETLRDIRSGSVTVLSQVDIVESMQTTIVIFMPHCQVIIYIGGASYTTILVPWVRTMSVAPCHSQIARGKPSESKTIPQVCFVCGSPCHSQITVLCHGRIAHGGPTKGNRTPQVCLNYCITWCGHITPVRCP